MNAMLDKLEGYLAVVKAGAAAADAAVQGGCDAATALFEYVKSTAGQFVTCDPSQASRLAACCDGLEDCRKKCAAAPGAANAGITPAQIIAAVLAVLNILFPKA